MRRKVFISILGTSAYTPVIYSFNGKPATDYPTRFVQEAHICALCKNWTRNDAIMIFRTEKSEERNWKDREDPKERGVILEGLESRLKKLNYKMQTNPTEGNSYGYIIDPGFLEKDIWKIFDSVYDKIRKNDEIYFDITHAFRSIPMFVTVLLNYCRFMKDVTVKGVYYGAFESLFLAEDIDKIPMAERKAPIVDMTSIVALQTINITASNFRNYGSVGFSGLDIEPTGNPDIDVAVEEICNALKDLDFYINLCRLDDIRKGRYMEKIEWNLEKISGIQLDGPFRAILNEIHRELVKAGFSSDDTYKNVEAAILWVRDHNLIQQSATLAREYFPYRIMDEVLYSVDKEYSKKYGWIVPLFSDDADLKKSIEKALSNNKRKIEESKREMSSKDKTNIDLALLLWNNKGWKEFYYAYTDIREIRNKISHASSEAKETSYDEYKQSLKIVWDNAMKKFDNIEWI